MCGRGVEIKQKSPGYLYPGVFSHSCRSHVGSAKVFTQFLLSSRLYCRFWNCTKSCRCRLADCTADREFHPALKIAVLLSANRLLRKKGVVKRETGKWKKLIKKSQEFAVYSCQKTSNHTKMEGMSSLLRCLCGDGNSRLQRFCSNEKHAFGAPKPPDALLCGRAGFPCEEVHVGLRRG